MFKLEPDADDLADVRITDTPLHEAGKLCPVCAAQVQW